MKRNREYIPYLRNLVGHKEIRATGVTALIINEKEEVLLEKRSDNSLFSLPGGALDRDETIYEGRLREIKEETGLIVNNGILFQIISPNHNKVTYPNGDITDYTNFIFLFKVLSKDCPLNKEHDKESLFLKFYSIDGLPKEEEFLLGSYDPIRKYKRKDFSLTLDERKAQ